MKKYLLIIFLLLNLCSCAVSNKISYLKSKKLLVNHLKIWENYKLYASTDLNLSKNKLNCKLFINKGNSFHIKLYNLSPLAVDINPLFSITYQKKEDIFYPKFYNKKLTLKNKDTEKLKEIVDVFANLSSLPVKDILKNNYIKQNGYKIIFNEKMQICTIKKLFIEINFIYKDNYPSQINIEAPKNTKINIYINKFLTKNN